MCASLFHPRRKAVLFKARQGIYASVNTAHIKLSSSPILTVVLQRLGSISNWGTIAPSQLPLRRHHSTFPYGPRPLAALPSLPQLLDGDAIHF